MAEFKLSRAVEGHRNDVKCLTAFPGSIVSGSRDETVKFWTLRGSEYTESLSLPQSLVVNSLALYRPVDGGAWIVFAGRKDGSIGAFSAGSSDPVAVLHEHKSNVCTLFVDAEQKVLMSGSWDANAIVWPIDQLASGSFNALGLVGHTMSVWSVSTVPNMPDHYLTGSADKTIRFWHHDNQLRSFHGHSDVVRSILTLSSSNFLTCSNDSTIRLWDLTTGECLAKYSSLSGEYLYSMCRVGPSASLLATSSEGGLLEFWSLDPELFRLAPKQHIKIPAESLWSVTGLSNGDVAVGASDSRIWVFTTESARFAPPEMLTAFDEQVAQKIALEEESKAKQAEDGKVVTIKVALEQGTPSMDLNYKIGTDPVLAAEKFIQENNLAISFLDEIVEFIKTNIPEANNVPSSVPRPTQRSQLNGKEWDYVFEITVDDGRKLQLPYNADEDPQFAAQRFVEENNLPIQFLQKVTDFLRSQVPAATPVPYYDPFTGEGRYVPGAASGAGGGGGGYVDPFTGGGRYVPGSGSHSNGGSHAGGADPLTGSGRYVPGTPTTITPNSCRPIDKKRPLGELVPLKEYFQFNIEQSSAKAMEKLKECNSLQAENRLSDEQLAALETLMSTKIVHVKDVHVAALEVGLRWPIDSLVPILDVFRIALIHKDLNKYFCDVETKPRRGRETLQKLQNLLASDPPAPVKILACRSLANATLHLWGRQMLLEGLSDTVRIAVHCLRDPKLPVQLAVTSALANMSLMLLRRTEEEKVDEMGPREDALKATLDGLRPLDSFGSYGQPALIRLLQAIVTFMYGDSALILIAKQNGVVAIVNRMKDAVVEESGKCIARDIVEMTFAV